MNLRRDHVAGGAFVVAGALVLAVSADLPFGSLASPGAGMLPTLIMSLLMAFGAILFIRASESPPLATIDWGDFWHAVPVIAIAVAATAVYTTLGFLLTVPVLLFLLVFAVERKPLIPAVVFSLGVTALAYLVFGVLLNTALPRGFLVY